MHGSLDSVDHKIQLEKKISIIITKTLKQATGKGPTNFKSYMTRDLFALRIRGFLNEGEVMLARTEQGLDKVKQFRVELTRVIGEVIKRKLAGVLGVDIKDLYFDLNVETDEGVVVLIFAEELTKCCFEGNPLNLRR